MAAAVALGTSFVAWERRAAVPLLPIRLFRHRHFANAAVVAFAYGVGLFGSTYLVPVFAQDIAHYGAAEAGYLLLPPGIALAIAIAIGGRLTDRLHPAPILVFGLALFALSSLLLAFAGAGTGFCLMQLEASVIAGLIVRDCVPLGSISIRNSHGTFSRCGVPTGSDGSRLPRSIETKRRSMLLCGDAIDGSVRFTVPSGPTLSMSMRVRTEPGSALRASATAKSRNRWPFSFVGSNLNAGRL
jgi:hypothetical protein